MGAVIEFEVFRDYLGVGASDPEADQVSILFDAINAEIRRLTHRAFEGDDGGSYDQVIRIFGATEFTLPWTPVETVTSIARHHFDGTEDDPYQTAAWRLGDPDRGVIQLRSSGSADWPWDRPRADWRGPEYVRVIWTTTGDIPAQLPQACLDWGKVRWDEHLLAAADQATGSLASYKTGDDAESYFDPRRPPAATAGKPPRSALLAILGQAHYSRGGVV